LKPIYLYGAGGLGREIQALLKSLPEWKIAGFLDDNLKGQIIHETVVFPIDKLLNEPEESRNVVVAIGNPVVKAALVQKLMKIPGIKFPTLIHPAAKLLDRESIELGKGCVISAGVCITCSVKVHDHVLINLNATVGHDVIIGSYCSIMPGVNLAGSVRVDDQVLIGSGATIINNLHVARGAKIGAGAVVIKDVPEKSTAVGVPARIIKQ
jgi:sugar O-acyltransferase (sialic acid O-acetyltransferase NeuD family)